MPRSYKHAIVFDRVADNGGTKRLAWRTENSIQWSYLPKTAIDYLFSLFDYQERKSLSLDYYDRTGTLHVGKSVTIKGSDQRHYEVLDILVSYR